MLSLFSPVAPTDDVMRFVYIGLLLFVISASARRGSSGGRGGGGRSGGSHSYPSSTGYSGTGSSGSGYSGTKNSHSYPSSNGLSGNTVGGHQRDNHVSNTHQQNTYHQKTEVHNHYHYNPPQQISYGSQHFPVYRSPPPVYVYEYRNSGSRFDTLLTGLALYNLGRMSNSPHYDTHREYRSHPGEKCILGIKKQNGDYEETRIDCKLMSSFIWEAQSQPKHQQVVQNNTTTVVYVNGNNTVSTTVQNTQVVDALQAKGPSIKVTPGMYCFMKHISYDSVIQKEVDCGVLQAYSQKSMYFNTAMCSLPSLFLLLLQILYKIML